MQDKVLCKANVLRIGMVKKRAARCRTAAAQGASIESMRILKILKNKALFT
jgi:hypothetical protein